MNAWRALSHAIGAISFSLSLWGYHTLAIVVEHEVRHPMVDTHAPLFRPVFFAIATIDSLFLAGVMFACFSLVRAKPKAEYIYTWSVLGLGTVHLVLALLWGLPNRLGVSIAAASGIASVGAGPLLLFPLPFVYPLMSVALVNLSRHKLRVHVT